MAVRPTKMSSATEHDGVDTGPSAAPTAELKQKEVERLSAELKQKEVALKHDIDREVRTAEQKFSAAQKELERAKQQKKHSAAGQTESELSPVYYRTRGQAKHYHNVVAKFVPDAEIAGNVRSAIAKTTGYGKELLKLQDKIDHVASAIQTFETSVQRDHRGQYKNMLVHLEDDARHQVTQLTKDSNAAVDTDDVSADAQIDLAADDLVADPQVDDEQLGDKSAKADAKRVAKKAEGDAAVKANKDQKDASIEVDKVTGVSANGNDAVRRGSIQDDDRVGNLDNENAELASESDGSSPPTKSPTDASLVELASDANPELFGNVYDEDQRVAPQTAMEAPFEDGAVQNNQDETSNVPVAEPLAAEIAMDAAGSDNLDIRGDLGSFGGDRSNYDAFVGF